MIYLLDTSALLAHYRNETGADAVQTLFEREGDELLIASVSLPEFARRLRDLGSSVKEAHTVVEQYVEAVNDVVEVDAAVATASFDLICKLSTRLPLVDALISAAAQRHHARLVHRDSHMRAIPVTLVAQLDLDSRSSRA